MSIKIWVFTSQQRGRTSYHVEGEDDAVVGGGEVDSDDEESDAGIECEPSLMEFGNLCKQQTSTPSARTQERGPTRRTLEGLINVEEEVSANCNGAECEAWMILSIVTCFSVECEWRRSCQGR